MFSKWIETSQPIHELIAARWSGRAYDPERDVSKEKITAMLEAARWAPSCFGDQPWRLLLWNRFANAGSWQRAFECLAEGNRSWAKDAAWLLVANADTLLTRNDEPNRWGAYDTGAAMVSFCLQAATFDVMTHQMGGFDADRIRQRFNIPDRYTPMAMVTVGYQLPLERMEAAVREREEAVRSRRSLGDLFFEGAWKNSFSP
jgi:nitroreductase